MTGGNWTRGAARRGNKNGRPPMHPPGTPLHAVQVKVPDDIHSVLRVMGAGNVAQGARMAFAWAAHVMPLWAQDSEAVDLQLKHRFDGKKTCQEATAVSFAKLNSGLRSWDGE